MQPVFFAKNFKQNVKRRLGEGLWTWKKIAKIAGIASGALVIFVAGVFLYFYKDLPSPGGLSSRSVVESTKIYDRTGNHILYEVHGEEKRTVISFDQVPDSVKYATLALEDQEFYSHHGIKLTSIIRAVIADLLHQKASQGGSTITQQLVKKSMLTDDKTVTRKIKEVILSLELETKYSKDEILGMYLNQIPYGSNAYGIEAASQTFFGKSAKELTLDEAALLVSLPQAPSYYSPYGSHTNVLKTRQEYALKQLADLGYITQDQAEEAKQADVLSKIKPFQDSITAPHFVMYIKEYLESKYGEQTVEQGGLKVYTTLDWDMQQTAEKAISDNAASNEKNWNAYNASLVAMDPKTGQVLAMVGSKDYFGASQPEGCATGKNCKFEGNFNVSTAGRQPGSSFKPYVYLTGFTKGYTPETMLFDVPTNFSTDSEKDYKPNDYDGKFRGPIQVKNALAQSLNVPAVEMLYLAGIKDSIMMAKNMGITTLNNPNDYGLSLVLGGGEITLLDHVNGFATLANGGIKHDKTAILKVEDSKGSVLEQYASSDGTRVVDEKYVSELDYIMSTNDFRSPIFGENSPLKFTDRPVAAKTGTTNDFKDGWTIGFTPSLTVGVWAGNNDNTSMRSGADGVNVAAPIWRAFMNQSLKNYPIEQFPKYKQQDTGKDIIDGKLNMAEDIKVCEYDDDEYCLANDNCPDKEVKKRTFKNFHTILYYVDIKDPLGDVPKKPENDPQYKNWEKGLESWLKDNKSKKDKVVYDSPPTEECESDDFPDENSDDSSDSQN
jgi:1A family penicillin-binding protein